MQEPDKSNKQESSNSYTACTDDGFDLSEETLVYLRMPTIQMHRKTTCHLYNILGSIEVIIVTIIKRRLEKTTISSKITALVLI